MAARGSPLLSQASRPKTARMRAGACRMISPPRRQPALMDLEMASRCPEQRRGDSVDTGAPEHIAEDLISFGAQAGFQVAQHRRAEVAVLLGQYLTALLPMRGARWVPRRGGHRLA